MSMPKSRPMSAMRMKKLSIHDEDDITEHVSKKIKKIKSKEEKEMKKAFETIAKKLLSTACEEIRNDVETRLREVISRTSSDIRHDVISMESSISSRIMSLETKINSLANRTEEVANESTKRIDTLEKELSTFNTQITGQLETERTKRLTTAKKLQEKYEQHFQTLQNNLSTAKHDNTAAVNALNEDLRLQVKEIVGLKEKVDEILIKQLGYLPRGNTNGMASVVNHGADSGVLIENMSSRIQKLEQAMVDDADLFNSFTQERGAPGSPSRFGNQGKKSLNRIRRIEEHLFEIESQIKENETDIDQLKQSLMRKFRGRSESPVRQKGSEASASEVKDLEKKIKKLAESTTKACRSLSTGLTDVQQATLSLYSWTDRVHDSFEVIAQKINLPTNLCPRAKLSNNQNNNNNRRLAGFDF